MSSLAQQHDCLLLDLDGTVFRGHEPTPGAVETLAEIESRILFVTNNASRDAEQVAVHLRELGFTAGAGDVVTSAQSAARLLADQLPAQAKVLVVGTDALAGEVAAVGLTPVRQWSDEPVAVVQGHSPETGWSDLAEAALAIRAGALWIAANVDKTLPSERGLLPGNGSMVAALRTATDRDPQVAGKPAPALMRGCVGARAVRPAAGRRGPPGHRHRRRQCRAAAQPDGAVRGQHRRGRDLGSARRAPDLPCRGPPSTHRRRRGHPARGSAPRLAGRRRPKRR